MSEHPIYDEVLDDCGLGTWGLDFFNPPNDYDEAPPDAPIGGNEWRNLQKSWDALPLPGRHWYADWLTGGF